jgi:hypothetical protein
VKVVLKKPEETGLMAKKNPIAAVKKGTVSLQDLYPRITIFPGEDKTTFEDLRQGFMLDLAPATPYETALVENLVTLEWETIRHRNIRDQLILTKFEDLAVGAFQDGRIEKVSRNAEKDEDAVNNAFALVSSDPEHHAIGLSALKETGFQEAEILAEAYTQVRLKIEVHEYKLAELEIRRRRLREDYDRLKAARAKPVEDAEVIGA